MSRGRIASLAVVVVAALLNATQVRGAVKPSTEAIIANCNDHIPVMRFALDQFPQFLKLKIDELTTRIAKSDNDILVTKGNKSHHCLQNDRHFNCLKTSADLADHVEYNDKLRRERNEFIERSEKNIEEVKRMLIEYCKIPELSR